MGYIYKITTPSNRVYVGQTANLKNRIYHYSTNDCRNQKVLYNSLKKYGFDNCKFEILEETDIDNINDREMYYIDFFKSNITKYPEFRGMNCTDGGEGLKGYKPSEETKKKMSDAKKGKVSYLVTEKTRMKISESKIGGLNSTARLVLDLSTGIYYLTCKEAAKALNINYYTLNDWLRGRSKNKSNLIYV